VQAFFLEARNLASGKLRRTPAARGRIHNGKKSFFHGDTVVGILPCFILKPAGLPAPG
jgi:hypothetical protein